jgi:hypothetical protein
MAILRSLWLVVVAAVSACGGGDDGVPQGPVDLPLLQHGDPLFEPGQEHELDPATARPADYSCHGVEAAPEAGDPIEFDIQVLDFQEDTPVPDACVTFHVDNVVPEADSCDGARTDADGIVTVSGVENAWYAYRVYPHDGPSPAESVVDTVAFNEVSPTASGAGPVEARSVSAGTLELIPTLYGFRRVPGTGMLTGAVFTTCASSTRDKVYGAQVRVARLDGTYIRSEATSEAGVVNRREPGGDPHYRYWNGDGFPAPTQPFTHAGGLFAVAQIPILPDENEVLVEAWGVLTEGGEPEVISCERAELYPDTVTVLDLGPLRSDSPDCPGLR